MDCRQLLPLQPDNFTPLTRTPWAGHHITKAYKQKVLSQKVGEAVGESWEFSCDPDFPSRFKNTSSTLADLVAQEPEAVLSPTLAKKGHTTCEILVKLLNATQPLSLQIHPEDNDPYLKPKECGKPESWLILNAEPGCGLYLGFSRSVPMKELRAALMSGEDCRELLQFVPVVPGDYFEIDPGVPHAIGPGVTLLEPQRIKFGMSGKTYRMWDWGRKYNARGEEDLVNGKGRELHIEEALRLTDPMQQIGDDFVNRTRRKALKKDVKTGVQWQSFPANAYYQVHRLVLAAQSTIELTLKDGYAAWVTLGGALTTVGQNRVPVTMMQGEPALLPHAALPVKITAQEASDIALIIPTTAELEIH